MLNPDHLLGALDLIGSQHRLITALQVENAELRGRLTELLDSAPVQHQDETPGD